MSRFWSVALAALMFAALISTSAALWPNSAQAGKMMVCNPAWFACYCPSINTCVMSNGQGTGVCAVVSF
jgi:hypothetical protein